MHMQALGENPRVIPSLNFQYDVITMTHTGELYIVSTFQMVLSFRNSTLGYNKKRLLLFLKVQRKITNWLIES